MKKCSLLAVFLGIAIVSGSASAFWWPWWPYSTVSTTPVNTQYTKTQYPIVLVHGVSGFNSLGSVINYFHNIPYNLERSGAKVHVASVSSFNSSEVRGQQLANYINRLGGSKYNIIGHSQGAPTARVAASLVPHKVASVTSVNGVNTGSEVADVILGVLPPGIIRNSVGNIVNFAGQIINYLSGSNHPLNSLAAAQTLSTQGTRRLNDALDWAGVSRYCGSTSENIQVGGYQIKAYSWGGNRAFTNWLDVSDYLLNVTALAIPGADDGLVSTCSQKFGRVLSVNYDLNHLDAINHAFGVRGSTDPVSLFRSHANRLKNAGL